MAGKTAELDRKVPAFSLPSSSGKPWKLADAAGRKVVVYFYPKDNTSGCTRESLRLHAREHRVPRPA